MRVSSGCLVVVCALAVMVTAGEPLPAAAEDGTVVVRLRDLSFDMDVVIDSGNARAIVVAQLKDDESPAGKQWPCRLIHSDPQLAATDPYVREVDAGSILALVNLSDETVTFKFAIEMFVGGGTTFTLGPDQVKLLKVKEGITVKPGSGFERITFPNTPCLAHLPGPVIVVPE